MDENEIRYFVEAALLAAGRPLSIDQLHGLFDSNAQPEKAQVRQAIKGLQDDYEHRGLEVLEIASGFRLQIKASMADRLQKLWEERPPRYSRALFETLALIAYRQPMTRGEIEEIRGVSVSANIMRSLLERDWVRVVGHRDVPGRPAMFGTTKTFLDYFGLKKLDDLPPLADLADWESLRVQLNLPEVNEEETAPESAEITPLPVAHAQSAEHAEHPDTEDESPSSGEGESDEEAGEPVVQAEPADTEAKAASSGDDESDDKSGEQPIAQAVPADAETEPRSLGADSDVDEPAEQAVARAEHASDEREPSRSGEAVAEGEPSRSGEAAAEDDPSRSGEDVGEDEDELAPAGVSATRH